MMPVKVMKYGLICLDCNVQSESMKFVITGEVPCLPMKCTGGGADDLPNMLDFLCKHSGHRIAFKAKVKVTKPHEISHTSVQLMSICQKKAYEFYSRVLLIHSAWLLVVAVVEIMNLTALEPSEY